MKIKTEIDRQLNDHGTELTAKTENGDTLFVTRGILQPLRYKNKMYMQSVTTEIGIESSDYLVLRVPAECELEKIERTGYITDGTNNYRLTKLVEYRYADELIYKWAVVKR